MADDKIKPAPVDPNDPKVVYQKNLDGAFEEVIEDLETTRDVLKEKIGEIAANIKEELLKPKTEK
jgi:ParB-like chromosome segregation protein Spo0J